jgi:hypothetical protein
MAWQDKISNLQDKLIEALLEIRKLELENFELKEYIKKEKERTDSKC